MEQNHYRTIPESEYQELKALAEGNKKAIEKVMNDSELFKQLEEVKKTIRYERTKISDFKFWFANLFEVIEESETFKNDFLIRYYVGRTNDLIK